MTAITMFDKIFGIEAFNFMIKISGETEDLETIHNFREHLIERVDGNTVMKLARKWKDYSLLSQVYMSFAHVDSSELSRFMMYMDYLSEKIAEGDFVGL